MAAIDATIEALDRKDARDIRNFGLGSTDGSLKLINRYFSGYLSLFSEAMGEVKGNKGIYGRRRELLQLTPEVLTLAALESAITSFNLVYHKKDDTEQDELSIVCFHMGAALERECYGRAFREHFALQAEKIEKAVKQSAGNLKYRTRLLRNIAREKGFSYEGWEAADRLGAAVWVINVLTKGPLFTYDEDSNFVMTPEALAEVETIMADLVMLNPRSLPQVGPVVEWKGPYLHLDSLRYPLVRTHQKAVRKFVEREIKTGTMDRSFQALNHAQGVLWRINEPMLDLVRWAFDSDLGGTVGLPAAIALEVPTATKEQVAEMQDVERIKFFKERREKKQANRGFGGERITLERNLATADHLKGKPFWTPMSFDYRGRVYAMPFLNFQGADHIRSLFLFEEGQYLTEDGLYWLKVHLANCGAFEKIDKAPFDDRVKWVDDNWWNIAQVSEHPKDTYDYWSKADSPFMFVAACKALCDALAGHPCHMPVSFDGTCSGLQHLCAMTRAPEGRLVNLTPTEKPNDVYQVVAKRVEERVTADLGTDKDEYAKLFIDFGITRSLVKRNVMTYSYSSKARGMTDQILEDTMRPLNFKVLTSEIPEHPFGEEWSEVVDEETSEVKRVSRHWRIANYLAKHTYEAIEEVVQGPAKAMAFLRDIAGCYAHEEKPTIWHTPLGFPVMMRYPNIKVKQIELFLHDKAIRFKPVIGEEAPGIKKDKSKNGIAPSFVHSLDACHLMMVLLAAKQEGINSVALVHDSFGCLPNDCGNFRAIIKRTFRDLYVENDVLAAIRKEAEDRLESPNLPELPQYGALDLEQVLQAEYCFA